MKLKNKKINKINEKIILNKEVFLNIIKLI